MLFKEFSEVILAKSSEVDQVFFYSFNPLSKGCLHSAGKKHCISLSKCLHLKRTHTSGDRTWCFELAAIDGMSCSQGHEDLSCEKGNSWARLAVCYSSTQPFYSSPCSIATAMVGSCLSCWRQLELGIHCEKHQVKRAVLPSLSVCLGEVRCSFRLRTVFCHSCEF